MYRNVHLIIWFLVICCISFLTVVYAVDTTKVDDLKGNKESQSLVDYQKQIDKIEKDVNDIKEKVSQSLIEGCNRNIQTVNSLITWVGVVATMFAVIIAIGGFFIGWEGIRSRRRREDAIKTLEEAKSYVVNSIKGFEETLHNKIAEIDKKFDEVIRIELEKLTQDTEDAAKKVKEIKEKGISTDAEKKIESLEKRIKFFEEIGLPDDPMVLYSKAMLLKEKNMLTESLEILQRVVKIDPKNKQAYNEIGLIYCSLNNYGQSINAYEKVIELEPSNPSNYWVPARKLNAAGKTDDSIKFYRRVDEILKKNINKPDADEIDWLNYFENLLILGEYEQADSVLSKLEEKIKSNENRPILNFDLVCLYFLQNNKTSGFKQIIKTIEYFDKLPFKKAMDWLFDDINPFLKLRLSENIYQSCMVVEKILLRGISSKESMSEIEKLKAKG